MLTGSAETLIAQKNRITIPARWRKQLTGSSVVVNLNPLGFLEIYPESYYLSWAAYLQKLTPLSLETQEFLRFELRNYREVDLDLQGRIILNPQELQALRTQTGNEVVILGNLYRLELWDKRVWEIYYESRKHKLNGLTERLSANLAGEVVKSPNE